MAKSIITRNGKPYEKVARYPYIYRGEDGYYIYRLVHKKTKTDTYVVKNNLTKEKFKTVREALNDQQYRLNALDSDIPIECSDFTVAKIWEKMKEEGYASKAEATMRKYASVYNYHIKPTFERVKLKDLLVGDINNLLNQLYTVGDDSTNYDGGYSYTFVESILKWFYWFYNFAYKHNYILKDQYDKFFDHVEMPKQRKNSEDKILRVLSDDEITKIFQLLRDSDLFIPALISLTTGCRPSETFALTWADIDFKNDIVDVNKKIVEDTGGTLTLKVTKTKNSKRKINMPAILKNELYRRKKALYEAKLKNPTAFELNRGKVIDDRDLDAKIIDMPDFVCIDLYGRYIKPSAFGYWAKKIRAEICPNIEGVEDFSFYTFRKTNISKMSVYLTEVVLLKHSGHSRVDTLTTYYSGRTNEVDEVIRNSVNLVGSKFGSCLDKADDNLFREPEKRYLDPATDFIVEDEFEVIPGRNLSSNTTIINDDDTEDIDF